MITTVLNGKIVTINISENDGVADASINKMPKSSPIAYMAHYIINKPGFLQYLKRHKIIPDENDLKQIEETVSEIKKLYSKEKAIEYSDNYLNNLIDE